MFKQTTIFAAIAGLVLALAPPAQAATITHLIEDTATNEDWRRTAANGGIDKPLDTDNVYGTDGYQTFGLARIALPAYVSSITKGAIVDFDFTHPTFRDVNDPNQDPNTTLNMDAGVWSNMNNDPAGTEYLIASVTIDASLVGTKDFGFTVITGHAAAEAIRIAGGGDDTGKVTVTSADDQTYYNLFNITGAVAGDTFDVYVSNVFNPVTSNSGLQGVAFDLTYIPEPATLSLLATGLLGLLGRTRRRRR